MSEHELEQLSKEKIMADYLETQACLIQQNKPDFSNPGYEDWKLYCDQNYNVKLPSKKNHY